jgi:putative ABC transport system permease protein
VGLAPGEYSALGLYLPRGVKPEKAAEKLYQSLSTRLPSVPAIWDKDEFKREAGAKWEGIRYFIVPLKMYISEVDDLLVAMNITSYVVFAMIVLIVLVSVNVTYKLVIYDRIREIATLRALGMQKRSIRAILLTEAFYLFIISLAGGLLLSGLFLLSVSLVSFSWIPGFEIFTRGGKLVGVIRLETLGLNALLLLGIVLPSALVPVFRASGISLPLALSKEK